MTTLSGYALQSMLSVGVPFAFPDPPDLPEDNGEPELTEEQSLFASVPPATLEDAALEAYAILCRRFDENDVQYIHHILGDAGAFRRRNRCDACGESDCDGDCAAAYLLSVRGRVEQEDGAEDWTEHLQCREVAA